MGEQKQQSYKIHFTVLTLVCRLGRNEELLISISDRSEKNTLI